MDRLRLISGSDVTDDAQQVTCSPSAEKRQGAGWHTLTTLPSKYWWFARGACSENGRWPLGRSIAHARLLIKLSSALLWTDDPAHVRACASHSPSRLKEYCPPCC